MTDTYLDMVNSGLGKQLASKLGLPRPVTLRRYQAGADFPDGAVLVLGKGTAGDAAASAPRPGPPDARVGMDMGWCVMGVLSCAGGRVRAARCGEADAMNADGGTGSAGCSTPGDA